MDSIIPESVLTYIRQYSSLHVFILIRNLDYTDSNILLSTDSLYIWYDPVTELIELPVIGTTFQCNLFQFITSMSSDFADNTYSLIVQHDKFSPLLPYQLPLQSRISSMIQFYPTFNGSFSYSMVLSHYRLLTLLTNCVSTRSNLDSIKRRISTLMLVCPSVWTEIHE